MPPPFEPQRPPLTNELFLEEHGSFASKYPSSRPVIVALRRVLAEDPDKPVEAAIGDLYQAAAGNPERAMHLLALRFYLADLVESVSNAWWEGLHGFTHYTDLLDRIGVWRHKTREPVVLVTFNYDRLLDLTVQAQVPGWTLDEFSSYIERPDWQLLKLHGSVGWSRVLKGLWPGVDLDEPNDVIAHAAGVDFDRGELRPLPWSSARRGATTLAAVPGIAVPTTLKQSFQCPRTHVEKFTEAIGAIDRLLIVGWRAAEPHVLELLATGIPPGYRLAICDRSDDDINTIHRNLGFAARRSPGVKAFTGGFMGLLEGDDLERWLNLARPGEPL